MKSDSAGMCVWGGGSDFTQWGGAAIPVLDRPGCKPGVA